MSERHTSKPPILIRDETDADHAAIAHLYDRVFGRNAEARLVAALRDEGGMIASLVAVDSEQVVGHIVFSPVEIVTGSNTHWIASLAPMAVIPDRQREGIGSVLIDRGLEECRHAGYGFAIVVGHPSYYPRFGFSHALVAHLRNPFAHGGAFMGIELVGGALSAIGTGRVVYPAAFELFT